ncbi:MAG: hypothetical protein U1E33_01690 [Rhodospirillales bacterium]
MSEPIPEPLPDRAAEPETGPVLPPNAAGAATTPPPSAPTPAPEPPTLPTDEIDRIIGSRHDAPYAVLGPHPAPDGDGFIVRAFLPGAGRIVLRLEESGMWGEHVMRRVHADGLFEVRLAGRSPPSAL